MALPSITELGLLQHNQHNTDNYAPWWTTLDVDFQEAYANKEETETEKEHPRKRRAVSPDDKEKPLPVAVPDTEDVPELEVDDSPESSPEPSPASSPESSPQTSPQTSPETTSADLALPIRRLLPPHYLLPLPLPAKHTSKEVKEDTVKEETTKRKRNHLAMANLLSPAPHVYCLYKMDRVDQLGGKRRGMRCRRM